MTVVKRAEPRQIASVARVKFPVNTVQSREAQNVEHRTQEKGGGRWRRGKRSLMNPSMLSMNPE